jgi:hypothetical protein
MPTNRNPLLLFQRNIHTFFGCPCRLVLLWLTRLFRSSNNDVAIILFSIFVSSALAASDAAGGGVAVTIAATVAATIAAATAAAAAAAQTRNTSIELVDTRVCFDISWIEITKPKAV